MSTFGKSTSRRITQFEALDDTPGPTAYDPAAALSLLNQDPNKHYGFLEKSNRWKSLSKDTLNEYEGHEEELMSSTGSRASFIHKKDHLQASHTKTGEKEEVSKLKKEMERLQTNFEKQNTFHEKEMLMLGERCHKLDAQLQAAVKEKNSLASVTAKKDKEIDELMRKQDVLRSNLEKAEKASISLREKQVESGLLQKKVVDLSKKQEKLKSLAKSSADVEAAHQELKAARAQLASLVAEKDSLTHTSEQLKLERKAYKTKSVELTSTLTSMKEEWGAREAKYKEESKEMTKRLNQQEEKLKAQKDDFKKVAEELYQKCARQKNELESEKSVFEHQKQAYLSRINELESDLEITERGLIEKDKQLDHLRQSSVSLQENTLKTEQSIHDYQKQLYNLQAEKSELQARCADLEEKRRALEVVSLEKEKEQAHFETLILSLQSTIDQYQAEHEAMVADHSRHVENKEQVISNLTSQLTVADQEMKLLSSELEEKKSELENVMQSHSSLSNRLKEESQFTSQRVQELEEKLKDSAHKLSLAQKKGQEQVEVKQSLILDLERKWNQQADGFAKEISMLKLDKADMQNRLVEAQKALHDGQERSDEQMTVLYRQAEEFREKLAALNEDYDALINSKDLAASEYLDTIADLEARIQNEETSSVQKINDYSRKIARLQAEMEDLTHTIDENTATAQQVENNLKTEIDILEKSLHQHKLDLESMTMQYQESQDVLRSLDDYHKSEKNSNSIQIQRLHREVSEKESANEKLRSQISELKLKLSEEEERVQVATANHSKVQSDVESRLASVEHELKMTVAELEESQASYVEANCNVLELFSKLVSTRSDYYQSAELSSSLQAKVELQKIDNVYLREELDACMSNLDFAEQQLLAEREGRVELEALLDRALQVVSMSKLENVVNDPPTELFNSFMAEKMENLSLIEGMSSARNTHMFMQSELAFAKDKLKSSVDKGQTMQQEYLSSRTLLAGAVLEALDLATNTWTDLAEAQNEIDTSVAMFAQEKQSSIRLQEKVDELRGELTSLQSDSMSKITEFEKNVESLEAKLAASLENVESLSKDAQAKEIEIHGLQEISREMTTDLQRKQEVMEEKDASISSLQLALAETENRMAQLSEDSARIAGEFQVKLEKSLLAEQALKSENADLQLKLTEESVALADLNSSYVESQKEIFNLQKELNQEKSVVVAKADEIEEFLRRTQELNNDMSEMAQQVVLNEQTIEELTAKEKALEKRLMEDRASFEEEKSRILKSHADTERDLSESIASLTSELRLAKHDIDETTNENVAVKSQLTSMQTRVVELEAANQEKDSLCQSVSSELSHANLEHESAIVNMKAAMDSQEKQFNEAKYLLQTEKTEALRNALFEKEKLTEKNDALSASVKATERKLADACKLNEQYEGELSRIRTDGKQEFGSLQNQIAELQAKHWEESRVFEKTVQDMSARLAEKSNLIHRMQSELADAQNIVQRSDIRLSNEVSNRELMIKSLESKLKEQKKELDRVQFALGSSSAEHQKIKSEIESTVQTRIRNEIQLATKELERENTELQTQLAEREHDESAFVKEIDKLQILLQEARQNLINEKENFDIQLQLLEQRGKLQSSEIKKIGDLNAELFGHSNTRQKIKHVAQLKEENMLLREQSLSISRERDLSKRRILNLERELESLRSVGLFNNRKMSRVGRSFQESSKHNQAQLGLPKSKSTSILLDKDKENSLNLTGFTSGGISFVVE